MNGPPLSVRLIGCFIQLEPVLLVWATSIVLLLAPAPMQVVPAQLAELMSPAVTPVMLAVLQVPPLVLCAKSTLGAFSPAAIQYVEAAWEQAAVVNFPLADDDAKVQGPQLPAEKLD